MTLLEYCTLNERSKLLKQWLAEKNAPLTPQDVTSHDRRRVWWRCEKGHEWQATVGARAVGTGCP